MSALLSRTDAAEYLGISTDTLDRLRAAGSIPASQVSTRLVKYRQSDLDAYIEKRCQNTASSTSKARQTFTSSGLNKATRDALQRALRTANKQNSSLRRSA